MSSNGVIVGNFINKRKILSYLEYIRYSLKVNLKKVFVYSISSNNYEYLVTFKINDRGKKNNGTNTMSVMHVKNGCIFSINALNNLIEKENTDKIKPNNEFIIDWSKYKDKLIIKTNGKLSISDIDRIKDFSVFFYD